MGSHACGRTGICDAVTIVMDHGIVRKNKLFLFLGHNDDHNHHGNHSHAITVMMAGVTMGVFPPTL